MAFINQKPLNSVVAGDQKKKTGTGFTNLNRIMAANAGNRLGQAVGTGVVQQAGQAKEALGRAKTEFNQQAEAGRLDTDTNKQRAQQGIQAAEAGNVDDGLTADFAKFREGRYGGPKTLENEAQVINRAQQAQSLGGLAGSAGGRQALLQRFVGGGSGGYSQGKQRLDNLLLGQGGQQDLREARRSTQGLDQQARQAADAARAQSQFIQNNATDFSNQLKDQLNTSLGSVESGVAAKAKSYNDLRDQDIETIAKLQEKLKYDPYAQETELTQDEYNFMKERGFDALNSQSFNMDIGKLFTPGEIAQSSNVATQEENKKAQALAKLTGQDANQTNQAFLGGLTAAGENVGNLIGKKASGFNNKQFNEEQKLVASDELNRLLNKVYSGEGVTSSADQIMQRYRDSGLKDPVEILKKEKEKLNALMQAQQFYNRQFETKPFSSSKFIGDTANAGRSKEDVSADVNSFFENLQKGANFKTTPEQLEVLKQQYIAGLSNPFQSTKLGGRFAGGPLDFTGNSDFGNLGNNRAFFNNAAGGWVGEALGDYSANENDKNLGTRRKFKVAQPVAPVAPTTPVDGVVGNNLENADLREFLRRMNQGNG